MGKPSLSDFEQQVSELIVRRDLRGAADTAAACRAAWPASAAGWLMGSIVALLASDGGTALALVEERLARDSRNVQCLLQKSESLLALGRQDEALLAAAQAEANAGTDAVALDALANFFVHAHEAAHALALLDRALAVTPDSARLLAKRAVVHRFLGHFDLAARDYEAALARNPRDAEALKELAELSLQTPENNMISRLEAALARVSPQSPDAALLHFGLAKACEDLGDYTASWQHTSTANRLERARLQYDRDTDRAVVDRMILGFDRIEAPRPDLTGERPIFIVGLPCTGIPQTQRIIGSHSQVHSAGERTALSEAIGITFKRRAQQIPGWLEYAASLHTLDGESIAREYLARCGARRGARPRICDSQPVNFFYCPLILRAFPQAHIVHLARHPLAACCAIYQTRFEGAFPFSCDLEELADFYVGYQRLMAHWRRVLPGRILDVAYEDLIGSYEPTVRRLLEQLELPFEEACLEFRGELDSSERWRSYTSELAPLRARLAGQGIVIE